METADVRRRVKAAIDQARRLSAERRERTKEASAAYEAFLQSRAVPLFQQVAGALKAENLAFVAHTPAGAVRLASESGRDFVELRLDTSGRRPALLWHVEKVRGRDTAIDERPHQPDVAIGEHTEEDLLDALADAVALLIEK